MGAARYQVVIVDAKTGVQETREWSGADLLKSVPWLKRMNAKGGDIYIRPLDGPELLLVAGLNAEALKKMRDKGFAPAVVIETPPGRLQAWVKLSPCYVPVDLRKHAVSVLSGVVPAVDQYGRLAGFTNQKAEKDETRRQPYALVHHATGTVAPAAEAYFAAIVRKLDGGTAEEQRRIAAQRAFLPQKRGRGPTR